MTVYHYFKTWRSFNLEHFKNFERFSSTVAKTIKCFDETGSHEDRHSKGRPRVTTAAEDTFIRVNCTSDCSPNKFYNNKHISTSTVQRGLRESGLHGRIAAKKPLLNTNKKKSLTRAKKHEQLTLDCPLVWWVQMFDFWFEPPCLCETQSRWTDYL